MTATNRLQAWMDVIDEIFHDKVEELNIAAVNILPNDTSADSPETTAVNTTKRLLRRYYFKEKVKGILNPQDRYPVAANFVDLDMRGSLETNMTGAQPTFPESAPPTPPPPPITNNDLIRAIRQRGGGDQPETSEDDPRAGDR